MEQRTLLGAVAKEPSAFLFVGVRQRLSLAWGSMIQLSRAPRTLLSLSPQTESTRTP